MQIIVVRHQARYCATKIKSGATTAFRGKNIILYGQVLIPAISIKWVLIANLYRIVVYILVIIMI